VGQESVFLGLNFEAEVRSKLLGEGSSINATLGMSLSFQEHPPHSRMIESRAHLHNVRINDNTAKLKAETPAPLRKLSYVRLLTSFYFVLPQRKMICIPIE